LAVKYKDLTAWVMGTYKTVCRFCKITNVYRSGHGIESLDDLTKNEEVKKLASRTFCLDRHIF